jgi:hypothetical protein
MTPMFESNLLSRRDIQHWVRQAYKEFYLRPAYVWQRLRHTTTFGDLKVGIRGFTMLLWNLWKG